MNKVVAQAFLDNNYDDGWHGNISNIYSALIQYAGQICKKYASDIVYDIESLQRQRSRGEFYIGDVYYCFYKGGECTYLDADYVEQSKSRYEFIKILKLSINKSDRRVDYVLEEVEFDDEE